MDKEIAICTFCRQEKPVVRLYLYPSKFVKPKDFSEYSNLYNEGDYFIYLTYCSDCGKPDPKIGNPFINFISALRDDEDMQRAYKDNIAMAFKDCYDDNKSLHENANNAAANFIQQLID